MTFTLELTEEQAAVQELVTSLALEVLDPAARDAEKARSVPSGVRQTLHATGLVAPVPAEQGGDGVPDPLARLLIAEGLAYGDPAIAVSLLWGGLVPVLVGACGTEQQRDSLLPQFVCNPEHHGGLALFEGYGRAPSEFETLITAEASGWRVRGRKLVVQPPSADAAFLVVGRDSDGTLRAAVVPVDDATMRMSGPHLGLDAVPTVTVDFDVLLDRGQVLAGHDEDQLAREVAFVRLCTAAAGVGAARRAVDYAARYAQDRVAFGRPIATFQGVAFLVADAHIRVQAAWLQLRQTIALVENAPESKFEREVSHAVGYATTIASEVTRDCVQVLGGHGFLTDHPVERWYRATAGLSTLDLDPTTHAFTPAL